MMDSRSARVVFIVLCLLGLLASGLWPALAQEPGGVPTKSGKIIGQPLASGPGSDYQDGELLVKLKDDLPRVSGPKITEQYGASQVRTLRGEVELWQVPQGRELEIAKQLSADPRVEYAEPNYRFHAVIVPNDPRLTQQWAHTIIKSPPAWDMATGSSSLTIAIIDTGIDFGHPDLSAKIVPGQNLLEPGEPWDDNGHGTHVAGIATAVTNNGIGVAGMDWQARIMPVRVLDTEGHGYASDVAAGVYWAYQNGAKILNLSLVGTQNSQTLHNAVNAARAAGSLVVASMGNCRYYAPPTCPTANPTNYPAAYESVIAVAATTRVDGYAYYSQYGSHLDLAAPGGEIYTRDEDGILSTMPTYNDFYMKTALGYRKDYDFLQGTSMAAPHVSGLAALIWSVNPTLTASEVQDVLQTTADDLGVRGWDPDFGHGRINAWAALNAVVPPAAPSLYAIDNGDGDGAYLVDWEDLSSATRYLLEEDSHPGFPTPSARYEGPSSQLTITGQAAGTWYYRVRAANSVGEGPWSNSQSTSVKPGAPSLDTIENPAGEDAYLVSWSSSAGALGYVLEEADNMSFSNPITRYVGPDLNYSVTGQSGGTWYYRVRAQNAGGSSPWSDTESTSVDPSAIDPPSLLAIDNPGADGEYLVDWTAVSGATQYKLEQSLSPYFDDVQEVYAGVSTQFLVVDQPGGTWRSRVRAMGASGQSPWSNQQSTTVTAWVFLPLTIRDHRAGKPGAGILNGDFEQGRAAWEEYSTEGNPLILSSGFPEDVAPHGGAWAAWMGRDNEETAYLQQEVSVPPQNPRLTYWHWIDSIDLCGFEYDFASVEVDGTAVEQYYLCANTDTNGWEQKVVDLGAFAGQSVSLRIRVDTDDSVISRLYVDDVSF